MLNNLQSFATATTGLSRGKLVGAIIIGVVVSAIIAAAILQPGPLFEDAGSEADEAIVELEERGYPGP